MNRLSALNSSGRGVQLGLNRVLTLAKARNLFRPNSTPKFVHIAGTNGKGSCAEKIAIGLQKYGGHSVGLFTSPHVCTYRERIRVNGNMLEEDSACSLFDEIQQLQIDTGVSATYFETLTLMALMHFEDSGVEFAVVECGVGGKNDATNIIPPPEVCILTSVSLDHQDLLGDTLEAITRAKCGIFKKGSHVVVGPNVELLSLSQNIAREARVNSFSQVKSTTGTYRDVDYYNSLVALKALQAIGVEVDINSMIGLRPRGRFERLSCGEVEVVLDAAHNADALTRLRLDLLNCFGSKRKFSVVLTFSDGHDVKSNLMALFGLDHQRIPTNDTLSITKMYVAKGENKGRALEPSEISEHIRATGFHTDKDTETYDDMVCAFSSATDDAAKNGSVVVVCGSFNALGSISQLVDPSITLDDINMNENKISRD